MGRRKTPELTPAQKIKREILLQAAGTPETNFGLPLDTPEQVDAAYERLIDRDAHWDYEEEFRGSGIETNLPCESSRHYESKAVARKLSDGSWVGWTYWYGGGKHGEPQAIDWMGDAYDVDCAEEEKLVVVRKFTRKE